MWLELKINSISWNLLTSYSDSTIFNTKKNLMKMLIWVKGCIILLNLIKPHRFTSQKGTQLVTSGNVIREIMHV